MIIWKFSVKPARRAGAQSYSRRFRREISASIFVEYQHFPRALHGWARLAGFIPIIIL